MRAQRVKWYRRQIAIAATVMLSLVLTSGMAGSHPNGLVGDPAAPWTPHIRAVDEALAEKRLSTAMQAWYEAYQAARGSRHWEAMVEVGDAYLRIGEVSGFRKASEPKARQIYLTALFRARQQGALDGVLRTAEVFAALGDREVVVQCLRIAEGLVAQARDAQAHARAQALRQRLAGLVLEVTGLDSYPF